jgi:hypothetical protein
MKLKKIILSLFVLFLTVSTIVSCKKSAFDINKNPNTPTENTISYGVILPSALNNTGRIIALQWGPLQNYLSFWSRSGTYAPNSDEESYNVTTTSGPVGSVWNALYDNLFDYETMRKKAEVEGADFYSGIARIMKAHNFAILVDIYGNVPYSEALKGSGNITPKYDKGADIYKDLLLQIDQGIALIKNASNSVSGANKNIVNDDIMFGTPTQAISSANIDAMKPKWGKFANTLKLRLLVHLMNGGVKFGATTAVLNPAPPTAMPESVVPGFNIAAEIAKITANGYGFMATGVGSDAEVNPGYRSDKPNPFFNSYVRDAAGTVTANSQYYKANAAGILMYNGNGDSREGRFYSAGGLGFVGVAYGAPSLTVNSAANLAGIGEGVYRGNDKPQFILTSAESQFLQAEAIHRGFLTGSANSAMQTGIAESFRAVGATGAPSTYFSFNVGYPDVDYNVTLPLPAAQSGVPNTPIGGLYTIISQKWFALNAIAPFEVWTDYRRVDYSASVKHFRYGVTTDGFKEIPQISVSPSNSKTEIPIRFPFPQNEYLYNPTNVGSQGTINIFTSKIFWDLN